MATLPFRCIIISFLFAAAGTLVHADVIFLGAGQFGAASNSDTQLVVTTDPGVSTEALAAVNGITGLQLFGTDGDSAVFTAPNSGSGMFINAYGLFASNDSPVPPGEIFTAPSVFTNFDFTLSDSNTDPIAWTVLTCIFASPTASGCSQASGTTGAGGGAVSGSVPSNAQSGFDLTGETFIGWESTLTVSFVGSWSAGDTLILTVPQTSIDLTGASSTPEPTTAALAAAGAALLLTLFRFRRPLT